MKLVRFMGPEELQKYLSGEVLRNDMSWKYISKSSSVGFCFFPADPPPEQRLHYLSGVVSFNVVAEFETIGPLMIRKGAGRYRDPEQDDPKSLAEAIFTAPRMMEVEEYSMREYSLQSLRLLRIGRVTLQAGQPDWRIKWAT